ncbi:MAG: hypothetical protein ABJ092_13145 [Gillisia sp.]
MKTFSTILFTCLLLLFQSCSEKDKECSGICTEEYRTIVVEIKTSEGEPVILDENKVVEENSGRYLTIQPDDTTLMNERGLYPIFSDRYAQEFRQRQIQIKFTGYIEGEEVVSEVYSVGADCCHVYYISGDLEPVI